MGGSITTMLSPVSLRYRAGMMPGVADAMPVASQLFGRHMFCRESQVRKP